MTGEPTLRALLEVAEDAARTAGAKALARFRDGVTIETKKDGTPVSVADRESEETIRAILGKAFPSHAILGEEAGGRITDWNGERTIHSGTVVISNGLLHDEALAALRT